MTITKEQAFENWARHYDKYSNQSKDLGADVYFNCGFEAGAEAKLAEMLAGVEMPEPTKAHQGIGPGPASYYTLTQLQTAVAAAVTGKDAEIAELIAAHAEYMRQYTAAYNQQVENYRNLQATSIANEEGLRQQLHIANARIRALQKLGVMVEDLEKQMEALTAERDTLKGELDKCVAAARAALEATK